MATNTDRLSLRHITESDNWSAIVDKLNFNFDQVKAYGGGDKGSPGGEGKRGLPGATGIGKKGDVGQSGATIRFSQIAIVDGSAVTDPSLRAGDVVIDSNSSFFSIINNNLGNPVFKFEYSLISAAAGSIVQTENQVFSQSLNPVTKWYLRTTGNAKDAHAMFVDRVVGAVTDEAQLYRAVIGDSGYPLLQNASLTLVNILPDAAATSAKGSFFAQLAFKYRSTPSSNISSNTGYLRYLELNKNEATPAGADDTYMVMENVSAGFGAVHDSVTTDASYALVRGRNTRFMGKTALIALYSSGALNNSFQYVDVIVDATESHIEAPNLFKIQATSGKLALMASTLMSFDSVKNFFKSALYIGVDNFNDAATYAPANGAVIQGQVGIGYTAAPTFPTSMNGMLSVNGDIYMGSALAFGGTDADLKHVWLDNNSYQNVSAVFNFVSGAYKSIGNAGIKSGGIFTDRGEVYDRLIVGAAGWTSGLAQGLSVQGRAFLNNITEVNGKLWGYAGAEFNGVVGMQTTNFYTRASSQVDIRNGEGAYIGSAGQNYSVWRYHNNNDYSYLWLGYRSDTNDWRLSHGGLERTIWHSGNDGVSSGLDADLLDGYHGSSYLRKDIADYGNYLQFFGTEPGGALYLHQNNGAATQIQRWYFGTTLKAYMAVDGIMFGTDFYILSDRALKTDIKPLSTARDVIGQLKPVNFKWKMGDGIEKSGFIAQDVQKVLPNMVRQGEVGLGMSNSDLVPYLVKGLQEAFAEIEKLKKLLDK